MSSKERRKNSKSSRRSSEQKIRNQYGKNSSIREKDIDNKSTSSRNTNQTNNSINSENDRETLEIDNLFIEKVKQYKELQNKKRIIMDANKKVGKEINEIKVDIMDYMKDKGFFEVFYKDGKLKLCKTKRTKAINNEILQESFKEYLKSDRKTDELFELINSKREVIEGESLRQLKNKNT